MGHSSSENESPTSDGGHVKSPSGYGGRSSLSMLPLVALIFYSVSGGPFGVEDSVKAGGPLLALLGFLLFPFVWSIPEALVTAELATTFPENGGYVVWISAAFGDFWGFQEGWWKWLSGVIDNALYPVLFLDYLKHAIPIFEGGPTRVVAVILITAGLTYLNYRGLNIVGYTAVGLTIFSLMPFCIMTVLAVPMIKPERWFVMDLRNTNWRGYLNTLFWNLNYWDSASTLAGEVENPQRTFPKALFCGVLLVVGGYLIPLLAGTGALGGGELWEDGYFADVAMGIGGVGLKWWVEAAAALSNMGLFLAEMSSDSFQLLGMGERGMLPAAFSVRSQYGTPFLGILCSATGVILLSWMSFQEIVEVLNYLYCLGMLLEFMAFIWLRVKQPDLPRPYRIPLNTVALTLLLLIPSALLIVVMAIASLKTVIFSLGISLVGFATQPALEYMKKNNWADFAVSPELPSLAASEADNLPSHPQSDEPFEAESLLEKGHDAGERH